MGDSAQERADRIKARRQAETEDTFDTRPVLNLVPPPTCGQLQGDWVCVSTEHPAVIGHYFAKRKEAAS